MYACRSPLRTGTLRFTEQGLQIEAMEARPPEVMGKAARIFLIGGMSALVLCTLAALIFHGINFGGYILFACIAVILILNKIGDRKRVFVQQTVPYAKLHGVQLDNKLRWITLVFSDEPSGENENAAAPNYFLTLNNLDSATVAGIADTITYLAPHAVCEQAPGYEWTRGRQIVVAFFAVILFAMIASILWLVTH